MRAPRFLRQAREAARRQAQERRDATGTAVGYTGISDLTGVSVTPKSALSLAAAFACINVIATDVAALPLAGYRKRKSGGRDQVDDLAGAELLGFSPDGETTGMRWRQAWMGHALGWGNGIARVERSGDGEPAKLRLLDAGTKARRRRADGVLYYEEPGQTTHRADDVLHLAGFGYDGLNGYTPPALLRQAFALGLAAEGAGAAFYGHGLMARGGLKVPPGMPKEARERLRRNFEAWHAGVENFYRLPLLEEGVEFQPFTINPVDAQFLETRKFQVLEVCRIYRVPPHKVMDYSQAHLANLEESNLDYLTTTLMPWCEAMETVVNMKLLTAEQRRQGYFFEHIMAALLRGNMQARAQFYEVMERIGVMSPNDIAQRENLNPLGPAGDVHLVMGNMTTLDKVGQNPAPAPATPPGRSLRFNPNHDPKTGQFTGKGGGGPGRGDYSVAADKVQQTAAATGLDLKFETQEPSTPKEKKFADKAHAAGKEAVVIETKPQLKTESEGNRTKNYVGGRLATEARPAGTDPEDSELGITDGWVNQHYQRNGEKSWTIPHKTRAAAEKEARLDAEAGVKAETDLTFKATKKVETLDFEAIATHDRDWTTTFRVLTKSEES